MANVVEILVKGRDQFSGPAQKVRSEAQGLGGAMSGLGKTVLGVAGGFVAAQVGMAGVQKIMSSTIGAAMAYEHQLAVIRALTGATKEDTAKLDIAIKGLTKTLPKSPAELGAGAYFILSSGIKDVATATKVLELSAKASTIGLGETKTVATVLTSIMNAYQLQVTDAAKATDTLVNIVKLGKGEPTEFAGALGRVIPIAAQMGIEFEQVGAVLATLTNTGLSAEESVVALRGIMVQILKPTDEAREAFAAMGFDVVAFRKELDENFVGAMARLSRSVGDNEEAWATLFPEVRGMVGVMAAFGNQLPQTEQNLADITAGVGALDQGFEEVSDTTQFKAQMAVNDLNTSLQELGADVLPAVVVSLNIFKSTIEAVFNPLDTWVIPVIDSLAGAFENLSGSSEAWAKTARDMGMQKAIDDWRGFDNAIAAADKAALAIEETITGKVAPSIVDSLSDIEDAAKDAEGALTGMFRETTSEELGAEAALADLKLEAARLEAKTVTLSGTEKARLDQLNNKLIPAQQNNLDYLRAQKDATEKHALANSTAAPKLAAWAANVDLQASKVTLLNQALGKLPTTLSVKIALGLAKTAELDLINTWLRSGGQGSIVPMQHGGTVRSPLQVVGERGPELAALPMGSRVFSNTESRQMLAGAGGGGQTLVLNFTFSGPVLGDQSQANQLVQWILPALRAAVR